MNKTNLRVLAIDYTLSFLRDNGRGVREQYLRDTIKRKFPMTDEREQRLWLMSLLEDMKGIGAISIVGSAVMITDKGREIAEAGGMEQYRQKAQTEQTKKDISFIFTILGSLGSFVGAALSAFSLLDTFSVQMFFALFFAFTTGVSAAVLWQGRRQIRALFCTLARRGSKASR